MKKRKSRAFGKDIFLLGENSDGELVWLEAPSWDWRYWGFGYIETYTNNRNPETAKDIQSHSHFSGLFGDVGGKYVHNVYDSPGLPKTTFTEKEGWEISELFRQFYLLKDMAKFAGRKRPGCNECESPVDHGDMSDWERRINDVMIPKITDCIIRILSPEE